MKEPTYQNAITNAWQVVWHNKVLWIFGLLAAFLGQWGLSNFFGRVWFLYNKGSIGGISGYVVKSHSLDAVNLSWVNIAGLIWLVGLLLLILIFVVFLAVVSQGTLIAYTAIWFKNKRHDSYSKAWNLAVKHFWSLLSAILVYKAVFCLLLLLSVGLLSYSDKIGDPFINSLLGIAIGVVLFFYLVLSILSIYTLGYIVIDNKKVTPALISAWKLFSHHVLVSLEVGIILAFFDLVLFVVLVSIILLAFLPAMAVWLFAGIFKLTSLAILGFFVGVFSWVLMAVLVASVYNAFNISAWMYLFIKMHKEGVVSRTAHWLTNIFHR